MTQFLSRAQCESAAGDLLIRYQRQTGTRLTLPIDVDLVGELSCDLTWDWEPIDDIEGRILWARLVPAAKRVDMNERYARDLMANQGLDRFTRGHEIGHWELHATHPVPDQLTLFPLESIGAEPIFCRGKEDTWPERHADWFAAALLMPEDLFLCAARQVDLTSQAGMRTLKDICDVSWSALSVRLKALGITHLERDGRIYSV